MPRPTIFISHSSKGDDALARLEAVAEALDKEFQTWIDRHSLRFGKLWHPQVAEAMASCDAAVVLLDGSAMRSDYVRHEISVVMNRVETEKGFKVFAVILDPKVSRTSLSKKRLRASRVGEMQIWRPNAGELADHTKMAASLAAKIRTEIGRAGSADPRRERITGKIKRSLNVADDAFLEALEAMEGRTGQRVDTLRDAIVGKNPERRRWLLAAWFVDQAERELRPILDFLKPFYSELRSSQDQKTLFEMIDAADAYWISASDRDCPICLRTLHGNHGGVVAINGTHVADYTVSRFAHRALSPDTKFILVRCHAGASKDEVITSIRQKLGEPGNPKTEDEVRTLTAEVPTICVLPPRFIAGTDDTDDLDDLCDQFKSIVFIVWPGDTMDNMFVPKRVAQINPHVDLKIEARRHGDWKTFNLVIGALK